MLDVGLHVGLHVGLDVGLRGGLDVGPGERPACQRRRFARSTWSSL